MSGLCVGCCVCQAASSLCSTCFHTRSRSSGRIHSVLLLAFSIVLSFLFQYILGPRLVRSNYLHIFFGDHIRELWACQGYDCAGNYGVYRVCCCTTLFFLLSSIVTKIRPSCHNEAWCAKYSMYLLSVLASAVLVPNLIFDDLYLPLARLASAVFLVWQQLILIDLAYHWNDAWRDKNWHVPIVACCVIFFGFSIASLFGMYHFYAHCSIDNQIFILLTFLLILIATAVQLLIPQTASLLTSSIVSCHATYLLYSAVSKNPANTISDVCHAAFPTKPTSSNHVFSTSAGMFLTFLSLAWTAWAYTSKRNIIAIENDGDLDLPMDGLDSPLLMRSSDEPSLAGLVCSTDDDDDGDLSNRNHSSSHDMWKMNISLALVSCWVCVTLTGWGSSDLVSGKIEMTNVYIMMVSQWVSISLYIWTLVAPKVFPNRDFT